MSKIAVIGTGYVGLTTGACFAHLGHHVVCADVVPEKVERLQRGDVPILEAGLDDLVREGIDGGRLTFVLGSQNAARDCEFAYLCVPTPQGDDGSADLSYIEAAAREIGPVLPSEAVVVNKSTVPVGSTYVVERALGRDDVYVVSNPEFLREGSAVHDFLNPDRIVIGSESQAAAIRVASLFEDLQAPLIVTDPASAETIKYASNAFLAAKVSFVNAIANVCEAVGADVREVVLGMGYDKRIGFEFLKPGPGWGGSCFHPDETLLARRGDGDARLLTFAEMAEEVERLGASGWEVLSWQPTEPRPEFLPVAAFTSRPFAGELVELRTKMGRRILVTPDHPVVVGDGLDGEVVAVKEAGEVGTGDWLPVAQGAPLSDDVLAYGSPLDALGRAGLTTEQVIVRLSDEQLDAVRERAGALTSERRRDVLRACAMRLSELDALGVPRTGGVYGTTTNGTYVPATIALDAGFWRVVGLWLAEGHVSYEDTGRARLCWSFHPDQEEHLVEEVAAYWRSLGVHTSVHTGTTSRVVSVSSRLLASWFVDVLGLGSSAYTKRLPDAVWREPEGHKRVLLSGLWDGDGSWSLVNGEFGTASKALHDGVLRLLGDLDAMATSRVVDGPHSAVRRFVARIAPTGYRRLSKAAAWVRVVGSERVPYEGPVYSLHVPGPETVVTTSGLVLHNCFPKDSRALVKIAEDAGYDFSLMRGVIEVNTEQYQRVAEKIVRMAGGSVDGVNVAIWGLTFKARTDDLRESPSLEVIKRLKEQGAVVRAYDPAVHTQLDGIEVCDDPYSACQDGEVLAVLTEWDEFRWVDFDKVREALATPRVVDARNLLDPAAVRRRGFTYEGIGR